MCGTDWEWESRLDLWGAGSLSASSLPTGLASTVPRDSTVHQEQLAMQARRQGMVKDPLAALGMEGSRGTAATPTHPTHVQSSCHAPPACVGIWGHGLQGSPAHRTSSVGSPCLGTITSVALQGSCRG